MRSRVATILFNNSLRNSDEVPNTLYKRSLRLIEAKILCGLQCGIKHEQEKSPCNNKGLIQYLAEAVRFELTEDSHPRRFSRPVHSTALPRFHGRHHINKKGFWQYNL